MSRIGKKAVPVPAGVTVNVSGQKVSVKGPKGELKEVLNEQVLDVYKRQSMACRAMWLRNPSASPPPSCRSRRALWRVWAKHKGAHDHEDE